jgi:hypothetical protein
MCPPLKNIEFDSANNRGAALTQSSCQLVQKGVGVGQPVFDFKLVVGYSSDPLTRKGNLRAPYRRSQSSFRRDSRFPSY